MNQAPFCYFFLCNIIIMFKYQSINTDINISFVLFWVFFFSQMGIGSVLKVTYGGASPSTAGPFLLNETFTKGKMKDKSSKKGGNGAKWNKCWLTAFPFCFTHHACLVGVCASGKQVASDTLALLLDGIHFDTMYRKASECVCAGIHRDTAQYPVPSQNTEGGTHTLALC